MTIRAGARLDATDFALPDVVTAASAGANVITATAFTDLPTNACVAQITNPHPTASMLVLVTYGAYMAASANAVRCCPRVSGSTTIAAGIGGDGAAGWGEIAYTASTTQGNRSASFTVELPVSANPAVFTMQAVRDSATGTQNVDSAVIRLVPLRFVF